MCSGSKLIKQAFRFELDPNQEQRALLAKSVGCSRFVYNLGPRYGSTLVVADRFYPSSKTCSACGCIKASLSLSTRVFACDVCGLALARDENAAINLRKLGLARLPEGLGEVTPVERQALALAPASVKPASRKQEAITDGDWRSTRRSTSKDVLVWV